MGRDDKGEKAPSVIVHLFEVRLPGNSRLLMVLPLLKHTGRSHFFSTLLSPSRGWRNLTIRLGDCGSRCMERLKQKTQTLAQSSSTRDGNTAFVCAILSVSLSDFSMKQCKQMKTTMAIETNLMTLIFILWLSTQNHVNWLSGFHHRRVLGI